MTGPVFRLRARRAVGGDHVFDRTFPTAQEAHDFAVGNIDLLAAHGAWRVRSFDVLELPSWRVVPDLTVYWHDPVHDPDPFAPVGDTAGTVPPPFAEGVLPPQAGPTGGDP